MTTLATPKITLKKTPMSDSPAPDVVWYKFDGDLSNNRVSVADRNIFSFPQLESYSPYMCTRKKTTTEPLRWMPSTYLGADILPDLKKVTVSCWIDVTDDSSFSGVFDYGDQFRVHLSPKQYTFNKDYKIKLSATAYKTWRNIAFTVDGKTLVPYDNGVRQPAITMTTALSTAPVFPFFGRIGNGVDLVGNLSDFRIYGSVLGNREMLNLYNTAVGIPPVPPPPATKNPMLPDVAWYKLDGNILNYGGDDIGKNDATSSNEQYSPFLSKKCFNLIPGLTAGTGNFLKVPTLPDMSKLTFSCYINVTSCKNFSRIFDYGDQFRAHLQTASNKSYILNNLYSISLSSTYCAEWRNIAFTIDGKTLVPYDNGIRLPAITMATALSTIDKGGREGRVCGSHGGDPDTGGSISDIRIYGRVLSDTEMLQLYTTTTSAPIGVKSEKVWPPPPTPDMLWYKLDGDIMNYCGDDVGKIDATSKNPQYSPYLSKRCFKLIPGAIIGTGNFLRITRLPPTSTLTFSCWINVDSYGYYSRIFDFGDQFRAHLFPSRKGAYMLNDAHTIPISSTYYLEWKHIAFTIDGTTLIPYDNGIRQKAITLSTPLSTIDKRGREGRICGSLGADPDTGGSLSDVRMYARALTDDEMMSIYKNP
jgi:Concanavalin A-like lectin/glucanases superfamily